MKKYIVRDGDTLESISEETGIRLSLLQSANPQLCTPFMLQPGEVISLPELNKGSEPGVTPVAADAVSTQSQGNGETPGRRVAAKPVTNSQSTVPGYFGLVWPHVVQPGETWSSVASAYQVSPDDLHQMNAGKHSAQLHPGDILYVPNVLTPVPGSVNQPAMPERQTVNPSYPFNPSHPGVPMNPVYPGYAGPLRSTQPQGPMAAFPGGGSPLGPRAVDALWRTADEMMRGWRDVDDSSSYESSWSDGDNWGGSYPHGQ